MPATAILTLGPGMGHGMVLAAAGTLAGLAAFPLVSRGLESQFYGEGSADAATIAEVAATATIAEVAATAIGAALAASAIPSRRAQ